MTTKPGVVLVHGAWHTPWHFANVKAELESKGYIVEAPALPSVGLKRVENSMAESIAAVKQAIYNATSSRRNAVVISHSMGGVVGNEAVAEFEEEMRVNDAPTQHGRVSHLLFIAAIIVEKGTEFASQNTDPHRTEVTDGMAYHLEPIERFYNTMEPALAQECAARLLGQCVEAVGTPARYRGWADYGIPVTYVACERDMALKIDTNQRTFIKRFEDAGVRDFRVERIDCDHTPWLSNGRNEFFRVLWDVLDRTEKSSEA